MSGAWRSSHPASSFTSPKADHIADQVAAAASRVPGLPGHQPWLEVNLPGLKLANRKLSEVQVGRLLAGLRDMLTSQESGTVGLYVQLGAVLNAVRHKVQHGRWAGWLANSCINKHTAEQAMRYHEAVGDEAGCVDMERLASLLRRHGFERFRAVSADEIKPWDVSCRTLSKTIKAAANNTRAVESTKAVVKNEARLVFDDHPDLREDAKRAEALAGCVKESLSPPGVGAAHAASIPFDLHSAGVAASVRSGAAGFSERGDGAGGGAVGRGAGGIDTRVGTGGKGTAGARGSLDTPRPPAGGLGVGAVQLTLDARYEAARLCRDVAGRIDRGELSDGDVEFVAESLRLLGSGGGSRGQQPPTSRH